MQLELSVGATPLPVPIIVTKAEYARYRGCSQANITKYIKKEKLAPPALLEDGRINRPLADAQLKRNLDPARSGGTISPIEESEAEEGDDGIETPESSSDERNEPDGPVYALERAHSEALKRQKLEIELARTKEELILREDVEREAEATARSVRNKMLELPQYVVSILIEKGLLDPIVEREATMILSGSVVKLLTDSASEIEAGRFSKQTMKEGEASKDAE